MDGNRNKFPYIRVSPDLYEELAQEAQQEGLIPSHSRKGPNAVNLGIEALLKKFVEERGKARVK